MKLAGSAIHFTGFYLFFILTRPFLWLPMRVLYLISDFLYFLVYYFPGYRKRVVFNNLRNSFPEKTEDDLVRIAKKFYSHLCDSFIESFAMDGMNKRSIIKRCRWKNIELLDRYYAGEKSVIAVFGHYGNWEWLSGLPLQTGYRVLALYKPLSNIYFDRYMKNLRQKFGLRAVPVIRTLQVITEYYEKGVPTITLFLGDQRPMKRHIRYWTGFLNQDTPVMLGSEQIAKRLDQVVVFLSMNKIGRGHYEVEIIPVTEHPQSARQYEITEMHTRLLESQIRKRPEYWLWSHKRWKHKLEVRS